MAWVTINDQTSIGGLVLDKKVQTYSLEVIPQRATSRTRGGKVFQHGMVDGSGDWREYSRHTITGFSEEQYTQLRDLFKVSTSLTFISPHNITSTVVLVDAFSVNSEGRAGRAERPNWTIILEDVGF